MLAIHNLVLINYHKSLVANAYAKLSKCQQFTTYLYTYLMSSCCKRLCKVIKMLAIHNCFFDLFVIQNVANAYAKLSKCQQFTTFSSSSFFSSWLQTLMQSYQNVSNSQPFFIYCNLCSSCKRLCKVIKMLAIHNRFNAF